MSVNSKELLKIINEFCETPIRKLESYDFFAFLVKRARAHKKNVSKEMAKIIDEMCVMSLIHNYHYVSEFIEYIMNAVIEKENKRKMKRTDTIKKDEIKK